MVIYLLVEVFDLLSIPSLHIGASFSKASIGVIKQPTATVFSIMMGLPFLMADKASSSSEVVVTVRRFPTLKKLSSMRP